jgi:hypothetical protein
LGEVDFGEFHCGGVALKTRGEGGCFLVAIGVGLLVDMISK